MHKIPVLAVMGPTGSGKTEICLSFPADRFEIINCDSRQVYIGMTVGRAAANTSERAVIPHHCTSFLYPDQKMNAGIFIDCAQKAAGEIHSKGKVPVIAGGTGFYFKAFRTGLFEAEVTEDIKKKIRGLSKEERLELLKEKDPESLMPPPYLEFGQGKLHFNDDYRISRALEITLSTGIPWSRHWKDSGKKAEESPYSITGWFLDPEDQGREAYRERLRKRVEKMIDSGFAEEAVYVREKYGQCPALETLGYPQALEYADGRMSRQEMAESVSLLHFQYAKRQISWFKKEPGLERITREKLMEKVKKYC